MDNLNYPSGCRFAKLDLSKETTDAIIFDAFLDGTTDLFLKVHGQKFNIKDLKLVDWRPTNVNNVIVIYQAPIAGFTVPEPEKVDATKVPQTEPGIQKDEKFEDRDKRIRAQMRAEAASVNTNKFDQKED